MSRKQKIVRTWYALIASLVFQGGAAEALDRDVVTRGVSWLDSPVAVRLIEKVPRHYRRSGDYKITDVYKDRLGSGPEMTIEYNFVRIVDSAPMVLVGIDIWFDMPNDAFLVVGERLQNRYGAIEAREKITIGNKLVLLDDELGVMYYRTIDFRDDESAQVQTWSTGDTRINHTYLMAGGTDAVERSFHVIAYSITNSAELYRAASDLHNRKVLKKRRQEMGDDDDF